ncbi:Flagellar basal-body rod protein FlgB [Limimaricola hongkongensis DSM 17492]|uniref:Flagellar basal body rod protein FlgB n=2 Tax=Limimaricola hongkongensis TaxID=278132 RepID=A0A017HHM4_9RHOB|nr:Flagellar basal-body rod protein FlgB [Limimaricola hongkongensis DSM 17492]
MLDGMSFFALASKRLDWLASRQKVISENVANADTPGFRAREVSGFDAVLAGAQSGVATTDARHITSSGGRHDATRVIDDPAAWDASIDGNTVVLEQQTVKAAEVSESYRLASQLYRKGHELLSLSVTGMR